ncbi:MAG TPA: PfkB family carbohydrate kinase [Candidatus Limnocylindria bacterium]|nr:PfkB family carbohydrate kinase [Candidatus Limnocylindria bacterium]
MSILVVGSVAYDDVETAAERRSDVLGGAASYFSVAAAKYAPVRLCGVVGDDFRAADRARIAAAGVDLAGLERRPGRTFRWLGRYDETFGAADTINTDLGVFASWRPVVPLAYLDSELLFLANIDPDIQLAVRGQLPASRFVALDTMNYWIGQKRDTLLQVVANVDLVCLNEGEIRQLCETPNVIAAARTLLGRGPAAVVVKRAEHGATLFTADGIFWCPAYPVERVVDPTGAGDSFAGGLVGSLAAAERIDGAALRRAVVEGSVCASFTVESFGIDRLQAASATELGQRRAALKAIVDVAGTGVPFALYEGR